MGGETDGPDNELGGAPEPGGQVVQLPRDWFGPQDELVPLRRRRRESDPPQVAAEPDGEAESNGRRAPMAVDFWGGVAAPEELVRFPGRSSEADGAENHSDPQPERPATGRPHFVTGVRGRRAAVGLAVLFVGLVAIRALSAQSVPIGHEPRSKKLAEVGQPGLALDSRDEPRDVGVRRLAITRPAPSQRSRAEARLRHVVTHRHASRARSGSPTPSTGQPVAYSPPAATQSSASSGVVVSSSGDSSSGSGSGGGSSRPGPTGPGAPFGPGTLGK